MNDLGNRLDALAAEATASVRLSDPSQPDRPGTHARTRQPRLAVPRIAFGAGLVSLLVVVGAFTWWQGRSEPSSSLVVAGEAAAITFDACSNAALAEALSPGVGAGDYVAATSYSELADQSAVVVSGKLASAERVAVNGYEYIELSVVDVTDTDWMPRPDIEILAYPASRPTGTGDPDPLEVGLKFDEAVFVGFLSPWSGVRGGWAPGPQGLYVACNGDDSVVPVIDTAESLDDPADATATFLLQVMAVREELAAGPQVTPIPPPLPPEPVPFEGPCSAATIAGTIGSANPVFDPLPYPLANSYDMLAMQAPEIVSGSVTSLRQIVVAGQVFAELAVADVVDVSGAPQPEITAIVYQIPRDLPTPLVNVPNQGWALEDMVFVGFLGPVPGAEDVPAVRTPGPQGLYLSCGDDEPVVPVFDSAAGPSDSRIETAQELLAHAAGTLSQNPLTGPPEDDAGIEVPCSADFVSNQIRADKPVFDDDAVPSPRSYQELADRASIVVSGTAITAELIFTGEGMQQTFVEVDVIDVIGRDGAPLPEVSSLIYAVPKSELGASMLRGGVLLDRARFVGFLNPADGEQAGQWLPGRHGLYLACGDDDPLFPVVESAAGPDDPESLTVDELLALVTEG